MLSSAQDLQIDCNSLCFANHQSKFLFNRHGIHMKQLITLIALIGATTFTHSVLAEQNASQALPAHPPTAPLTSEQSTPDPRIQAAKRQAAEIMAQRVYAARVRAAQMKAAEYMAARVRAAQVRAAQMQAAQYMAARVRVAQVRAAQIKAAQAKAAEYMAARVMAARVRAAQMQAAQYLAARARSTQSADNA